MNAIAPITTEPLVAERERHCRWRASLHEAGHVVALFALWPTWHHHFLVSVDGAADRTERVGGAVRPIGLVRENHLAPNWRGSGWFVREYLRREGARLYAGAAAESFRSPRGCLDLEAVRASEDDRHQLVALAKRCGRSRPLTHWPSLIRAQRLIDREWGAVLALTGELLCCGVVNSKRARAIVEAAPRATNRRPAQW